MSGKNNAFFEVFRDGKSKKSVENVKQRRVVAPRPKSEVSLPTQKFAPLARRPAAAQQGGGARRESRVALPREVLVGALIGTALVVVLAFSLGHVLGRGSQRETLMIAGAGTDAAPVDLTAGATQNPATERPAAVTAHAPGSETPAAGTAAAPSARRSFWTLRVYAAADKAHADAVVQDLKALNYAAFAAYVPPEKGYAVYVGRFADRNDRMLKGLVERFRVMDYQGQRPFKDSYPVYVTERTR